jgi:hemerythrin
MYEMKPEYYTGVERIDEEHKQLFAYAEEMYRLLHQEFVVDKYDSIAAVLRELADYTKYHFADEEAYMDEIHYRKRFTHKIQHQQFIDKLDQIDFDSMNDPENQDQIITDLLNFVTDWLVDHILEVDIPSLTEMK